MDSNAIAETTAANAWVESYLNALLTFGLSSEYAGATTDAGAKVDADRSVYSRYYVQSLLNLDEEALKNAWIKAASATKQGGDKDARLQYLSWRIWYLKRKHAQVERLRILPGGLEYDGGAPTEPPSRDYSSDEDAGSHAARTKASQLTAEAAVPALAAIAGGMPIPSLPRKLSVKIKGEVKGERPDTAIVDALFEDYMLSPQLASPHPIMIETPVLDRLYVVMISLHGLVRGERMELGRDSDTGGQVKYVVELARAMALHPAVHRVDLLTRLIRDPKVDPEYGQEEECIARGRGDKGGAYIVRLPCGPTHKYVAKEQLWPHVREFSDRAIAHISSTLSALADSGRRCELYCVHGHYADAGEAAVLICNSLEVPLVMTGHSLGRNKLEHLLNSASMTRTEIEATYSIARRIEAEERCLDVAAMVFTSTQQEIDEQWGLYDGYHPSLARVLRFRRSYGRHMPLMKVSPPGLDFSNLKVSMPEDPVLKEFEKQRATLEEMELAPLSPIDGKEDSGVKMTLSGPASPGSKLTSPSSSTPRGGLLSPTASALNATELAQPPPRPSIMMDSSPPIWQEIARFLRNPLKPAVLAMSRPDAKKNLTTLVKAFGEHPVLRELANLVLVMGNRDTIDSMQAGSQKVLTQVLKLIDAHDLYGSVAYPKHHTQGDISDIYLFARETRGVFVNIALQEPFGLTVIEAAAHGVPTVATCNGGPVDIMATLHHGVVVEPTNSDAVAAALLSILTVPATWDAMSTAGVDNIMAYSWPAHCKRYMEYMNSERRVVKSGRRQDRTMSGLLERRLSRLDLASMADPESVPPSPSPESLLTDMHRQFSTPAELEALPSMSPSMQSPRGGSGGTRKTLSGLTMDDMNVIQTLHVDAAARRASAADETALDKRHFVVIPLDSDQLIDAIARCITAVQKSVTAAGLSKVVGIGILSMLGFDSTYDHLQNHGIDMDHCVDFVVCNSGADVWMRHNNGRWDADERYEELIDFQWDRISLHRHLKKIISAPTENSGRLPRLKELLYNVAEAPEAGVHPRHICLELDPETQSILAAGMGPRARTADGTLLVALVTERLKRRLRSKGFRANCTLQIVPQDAHDRHLAVLHITPVRASRPLALRSVALRLGLGMDAFSCVVLPGEIEGSSLEDTIVGPWTTDTSDLLGGMQYVYVAAPEVLMGGGPVGLVDTLGLPLVPWKDVEGRVILLDSGAEDGAKKIIGDIKAREHSSKI